MFWGMLGRFWKIAIRGAQQVKKALDHIHQLMLRVLPLSIFVPLNHCSSAQNHVVAPVPQGLLQLAILNWSPWKNCPLPTGNLSFKA